MASANAQKPLFRHDAQRWHSAPSKTTDQAYSFHKALPGYQPTPLVPLHEVAKEIGVRAVYVKDESSRLGLPSFKILGASWGTFRALAERLGFSLDSDLDTVRRLVPKSNVTIHAATDGNHGRAVAWMGQLLGLAVEIRVPSTMHAATIDLIRTEEAHVIVSKGNYDQAVHEAHEAARTDEGILVQDFAFGDYQEIPQWIVEGYQTMMQEIEEQLQGDKVNLVVAPVGVGSFAQAVVSHFRRPGSTTTVLTVEPDTAACLRKSLNFGKLTPIGTEPTIMAGLDCGTPSSTAWPSLRDGVRGSVTVSDWEAHQACQDLRKSGISAGPCGGSTLAALRRLTAIDKAELGLDESSVIVLPSTEGTREYVAPLDVTIDDPVMLTQQLVRINSASPTMGTIPGPGETAIARYITAWLQHRGLESHWIEPTQGRPSIVGVS